jgi:glycolate oxidase FAD binding subunit
VNVTGANLAVRLEAVVGAAQVDGERDSCEKYAVDGVVPGAIAKPSCAAEIVELVRFAKTEGLGVVPCGHRTKLGIGMPPARYDLAIDASGLNQIAYYDPGDLTLSVDAGMSLAQLDAVLRGQNQFLPLAVPFFEDCTVGGTIAAGADSALRFSYGSARDFLLGAEFVNGEGTFTKSGGRVVKNVTGYDLHKLLIGSLGTLAVITRLNFRTFPCAPGYGCMVAAFLSVDAVIRFQSMISKSPLAPSTFHILASEAAQSLATPNEEGDAATPEWFEPGAWHAFVGFEGTAEILARYSRDLTDYAEQSRAGKYVLVDETSAKFLRAGLPEMVRNFCESTPAATIFKISTLPVIPADILRLRAFAENRSIPCTFAANAAGPLYFVVQPATADEDTFIAITGIAGEVCQFAAAHGGQSSILYCPMELKRRLNVWGSAAKDSLLMRRVKTAFDPQNIFAPGRFVANI